MEVRVIFEENEKELSADFGEILQLPTGEIPKEYGLITYDQNRTITVT